MGDGADRGVGWVEGAGGGLGLTYCGEGFDLPRVEGVRAAEGGQIVGLGRRGGG